MTTKENENFVSVKPFYMPLEIKDIEKTFPTAHLSNERMNRIETAKSLNRTNPEDETSPQEEIDKAFIVDKGHKDGKEIHIVTKKGIIFILNEDKFLYGRNCFITALFGRPNQVIRLYKACGLYAPKTIINYCREYQNKGLNETINN